MTTSDTVATSGSDVFLVAGAANFTAADSISAAGQAETLYARGRGAGGSASVNALGAIRPSYGLT